MFGKYEELLKILKEIRDIIDSPNTDVLWSKYNSVEEVLKDVDLFIERTKRYDSSIFEDLNILFAPTGAFQEISISGGWGYKFIEISSRFDELYSEKKWWQFWK